MAVCTGFEALAAGAHKRLAALSASTFRQRVTKFCAIYIITQLFSEQQLMHWVRNNHVRKKLTVAFHRCLPPDIYVIFIKAVGISVPDVCFLDIIPMQHRC